MKPILLLILIAVNGISLHGQQAVSTAGGNASGSGGTVSYTIGQATYTTITNSNGSVAQGVQQPYEIFVLTGIEEARGVNLEWLAYPNPAGDYLKLSLKDPENSGLNIDNLSYQLYNMQGKLLLNNKLDGDESTISMQNFSSGSYILKVTEKHGTRSQRELKTFKIIKH
jgi:hypothetical protein